MNPQNYKEPSTSKVEVSGHGNDCEDTTNQCEYQYSTTGAEEETTKYHSEVEVEAALALLHKDCISP